MSRPLWTGNRPKLMEVECRKDEPDRCEFWHENVRGCVIASQCPDCDCGPCGPNCDNRVNEPRSGYCKLVRE